MLLVLVVCKLIGHSVFVVVLVAFLTTMLLLVAEYPRGICLCT